MRYSFVSAALLALASSVVAQIFDDITSPTEDQVIPADEPFNIVWEPAGVDGTITITLLQGATNTSLQTGPVIKSGVNNLDGKLTWTSADGSFATYGFFFQHEQKKELTEYSRPFHIKGGKAADAGSSSSGGSTTTIQLSTGPSYAAHTSTTTTSVPSSTVTVVSTSTTLNSSSTIPVPTFSSASSNITIATLTSTNTGSGSSPTSSTPSATSPVVTPNAAANIASGGLAMVGGLILAFAL